MRSNSDIPSLIELLADAKVEFVIVGGMACGPKTAAKWLDEFGSLEGVVENAAAIKGRAGENLRASLDRLPLSRELVTIRTDVPLDVGPRDLRPDPPDAAALRRHKNESFGKTPLSEIWRHPIHTREFGSQLTNVLRCLQLEAHGYQLTVTELVGWEHSMKNELIIATHTGAPRRNASERLRQILQELNLQELEERFLGPQAA